MSRTADRFLATMKAAFFDREAVFAKVEGQKRKGLTRFGAFVRTRAQTSMRKRKKASQPGQPPSSHGGSKEGLRFILFAYDPVRRSVVVGPVPFGTGVPELHEFGGTRRVLGWRTRAGKRVREAVGLAVYPKRPFVRPALEHTAPKFPRYAFTANTTLGSSTRGI